MLNQQSNEKELLKLPTKKSKLSFRSIPSNINAACKHSKFNSYLAEHDEEINTNLNRELTVQEEEKIKEIFRKLFVFDSVPDSLLDLVLESLVLLQVPKGDYLFLKGSQNSLFYIIIKGNFEKNSNTDDNNILLPKIYKE